MALVRRALDLGVTLFDTAASYGTEGVVGQGLVGVTRDKVVIATKANINNGDETLSPDKVVASLETSLRLLRTDHVDVLQLHGVKAAHYDYAVETILPAVRREQEKGKVRFLGLTEGMIGVGQPIALVVMPGRIVAISRRTHPVLDRIADFARADARHQPRLVLRALELCAEAFLHEVRRINVRVDELEAGLKAMPGVTVVLPVQANEVFFTLPDHATRQRVEQKGARFYVWSPSHEPVPLIRLVCSFATTPADIETFLDAVRRSL